VRSWLWRLAEKRRRSADSDRPRLYVDSLNTTFDAQSTRTASQQPRPVGAGLSPRRVRRAWAVRALLSIPADIFTVLLAAGLITLLLLTLTDRPTRGPIRIPDAPLVAVRASMPPPAARSFAAERSG
jgi:hypothetical protein